MKTVYFNHSLIAIFLLAFLGGLSTHTKATDTEGKVLSLQERVNYGLIHAIRRGDLDEVRYLIEEAGADVNAKDDQGKTALYYATYPHYQEIMNPNLGIIILETFYPKKIIEIVKALIGAKADVNIKYEHDLTPLHQASHFGYDKLLKTLIKAGADIHARDENGNTPLHMVGSEKATILLINEGANIYAINKAKRTPLQTTRDEKVIDTLMCFHALKNMYFPIVH